jgi:hypothetical protein
MSENIVTYVECDIENSIIDGEFFLGYVKSVNSTFKGCGDICNATFINCILDGEFTINGLDGMIYENLNLVGKYIIQGNDIVKE